MAPDGCRQRRSGMEPIEMAKRKTSQPIEPHEIRKLLRQAIRDSGKTVYQLHIATQTETERGVDQGQLHKFMNDESTDMKASSVERLCKVLNLKLVKDDDSAG